MKKKLSLTLQVLGAVFALLIVLLIVLTMMVNSPSIQNRVQRKATEMLSDKIGSKASIDSVHINLFKQDIELYGVDIEDQQQRKMFELDELDVNIRLLQLLANKIDVEKARIKGVRAYLLNHPDEAPNYQFFLDAFKKDKAPTDTTKAGNKLKFNLKDLDLSKVELSYNDINLSVESVGCDLNGNFQGKGSIKDVTVKYEENLIHLGLLEVQFGEQWKETGVIEDLEAKWIAETKNGPVETSVRIDKLELRPDDHVGKLKLSRLHYATNNHQPRKNADNPKRGAFDTGHLNVWADLEMDLNKIGRDSLYATITQGTVTDTLTGFFIRDLKANIDYLNGVAYARDLSFAHKDTKISIASAKMQMPSKKKDTKLGYSTGLITINTQLKDIAQPFAPVLKNFTIPLVATTKLTGHDEGMLFDDIHVFTPDKKLDILAKGGISNLKDKYKLAIVFEVGSMHTNSTKAVEIINQFAVKKLMIDQLKSLNAIGFKGKVGIYRKNERFSGRLMTQEGDIDFKLSLDEANKYINGNVDTKAFNAGQAFDVKALKNVSLSGEFKVDFSKERTAKMRKDKSGKLPIGTASIVVREAQVQKLRYTDIFADVTSDGATALIDVDKPGKFANFGFDITYTSTTAGTKVKVKPKLRFNLERKK